MNLNVDAVLFDIDGTLVDSTPAVERTWAAWASRHGLDVAEILAVCHGRRSEDTIADFVPEDQQEAAVAEMEALELADLEDVVALPGAQSLLSGLPAGCWAAVTSGSQQLMRARLTAAGLPVPEVLIAAGDVTEGKPHPDGYVKAARALGADVQRCLVIEDAPVGIEAGRAAGAMTLGVATSHDPSTLHAADAVVAQLTAVTIKPLVHGLSVDLRPLSVRPH